MRGDHIKSKNILLVDDEEELLNMIREILLDEGYSNIMSAKSKREALEKFYEAKPDMLILDIMLPDGDGFSLLEEIRKSSDVPALFLSAKDAMDDQYHGFSLGADDYLTKPFDAMDLKLRLQAILRRAYPAPISTVNLKNCHVNFDTATVERKGESHPLTAKEFAILKTLCENANRIISIDALCQAVWGDVYFGYDNSLMAHIRRIREKIEENPSAPESLLTVKGLGYKLVVEGGS